ncbi:MAG: MarR family winged helix-turn-helix transcriptional regulator [Candidatus Acidiferrales bacterium]
MKSRGSKPVDYLARAEFRYQIRRFLNFSAREARAAGLEPQQHEAMLAIRGLPGFLRPTIGELAERLQIQHHSAVELANRLEKHGLIRRCRGEEDHREVLLRLTARGRRVLEQLSHSHAAHLREDGTALLRTLRKVIDGTNPPRSERNSIVGKWRKQANPVRKKRSVSSSSPD